jgi:hypothetical protein
VRRKVAGRRRKVVQHKRRRLRADFEEASDAVGGEIFDDETTPEL